MDKGAERPTLDLVPAWECKWGSVRNDPVEGASGTVQVYQCEAKHQSVPSHGDAVGKGRRKNPPK